MAFITDNGKEQIVGGSAQIIHRYAAWEHSVRKGKHQVIETSNDLELLKERYDVTVNEAEETFEAAIIDEDSAKVLSVDNNTACILLKRSGLANGKLVEYCETVIRCDRFKYKVSLK